MIQKILEIKKGHHSCPSEHKEALITANLDWLDSCFDHRVKIFEEKTSLPGNRGIHA
jgi:hypothetical protein